VTKATVTCALWNLYNDKKPKKKPFRLLTDSTKLDVTKNKYG